MKKNTHPAEIKNSDSKHVHETYLFGVWENQSAKVLNSAGVTPTTCSVTIEILAEHLEEKVPPVLKILGFGLVGKSVDLKDGDSGIISVSADPRDLEKVEVDFDFRRGNLAASFPVLLHLRAFEDLAENNGSDEQVDQCYVPPVEVQAQVDMRGIVHQPQIIFESESPEKPEFSGSYCSSRRL